MDTILVPVDFSPASKSAFQYAVSLANLFGSRVVLLHVYSPAVVEPFAPVYIQQALMNNQEELAISYFKELEKEVPPAILPRIELEFNIEMGSTIDEILFACEKRNPDLLVLGMRGGNQLVKKILGTTAAGVIQRADWPVLVVPENAVFSGIKNIAYATNFEEDDLKVIDKVLDFARHYSAKIHCIHIRRNNVPEDTYKQEILKRAFQHDLTMHYLDFETLTYNDVVKGLNHYVQSEHIDLLVMLTHNRGIFSQLFHKSHTKQMTLQTKVPLWIFQMKTLQNA